MDNAMPPSAPTETPRTQTRGSGRARAQKRRGTESRGYQTPDWLDRSFVLPVQSGTDSLRAPVPTQARPQHDDLATTPIPPADRSPAPSRAQLTRLSGLARPEAPAVDYSALARRNDAGRLARRTTIAALIVAALSALTATASGIMVFSIIATGAVAAAVLTGLVALAMTHAPVPRLAPSIAGAPTTMH